jgi:hypothetical protein
VSIDNDTNTNAPPPSAGVPSADSAAASSPPNAAPAGETPADRKKRLAKERKQRYDQRHGARAAGMDVPRRAAPTRVHRTNAARPDFRRFNAAATVTAAAPSSSSAAKPTPFAAAAAPAEPAKPLRPPVTEKEALPYGAAVAVWVGMGMLAAAERQFATPAERQQFLEEWMPLVTGFANEATVSLCVEHNLRVPYVREVGVASLVGLSAAAMFLGKDKNALKDARRYFGQVMAMARASGMQVPGANAAPIKPDDGTAASTPPNPSPTEPEVKDEPSAKSDENSEYDV